MHISEELLEKGMPLPDARSATHMPPNDGMWAVPHFTQFAAVYNWLKDRSGVYNYYFDSAIRDSWLNAQIMREDYVIRPALRSRQRPTCQLDWHLEPLDETNDKWVKNVDKLTRIIEDIPRFQQAKRCLLEAEFFGKYGIQLKSGWDYSTGEKRLIIGDWSPVHGDKIVIKYSGEPGILVNSTAFDGSVESTQRGQAHFLDADERQLFIWHEFEPEDADFYAADRAGVVHGLGFRGTLYWLYWLREKLTVILMDFLEKCGTGITIFFYEAGNSKSLAEVKKAMSHQVGNNVYLFPRNRDGQSAYAGPGIQRVEVSMTGADMFLKIFELINDLIRQAILGESGTTQDIGGGLNEGVSDQHGMTADERTRYDATDLEHPMQMMVNFLNKHNCPGDPPPRFKFLVDHRNPVEFINSFTAAYDLGLSLAENQIRDELSLRKPRQGEPVLSKIQAMQPAAVGQVPSGVPMSGPTGPAVDANGQPVQDQGGQQVVQGTPVGGDGGDNGQVPPAISQRMMGGAPANGTPQQ